MWGQPESAVPTRSSQRNKLLASHYLSQLHFRPAAATMNSQLGFAANFGHAAHFKTDSRTRRGRLDFGAAQKNANYHRYGSAGAVGGSLRRHPQNSVGAVLRTRGTANPAEPRPGF